MFEFGIYEPSKAICSFVNFLERQATLSHQIQAGTLIEDCLQYECQWRVVHNDNSRQLKDKGKQKNHTQLLSMANASLTSCQDLPLSVNTVPYKPDIKTSIVTVFTCAFIGLACPCAIVANFMVFLGVLRRPDLRNVYNTSILFLATSDLLTGLITLPSFVVYQGSKLTTPQDDFSCIALVMYTSTNFVFTGLSVITIILITLERYLAIFYPFKYQAYVTKRRIVVIISLVWVIWITFMTLARFSPGASPGLYSAIAAVLLIPCILLTFFVYCKVYFLTRQVRASIGHELAAPRNAEDIQETKSSRTVAYLAGAVVLCFVPTLAIAAVYQTRAVDKNYFFHLMYPLSDTAALLTPVFDPMIYVLRSSNVRSSLREMSQNRVAFQRQSNRARAQTGPTASTGLELEMTVKS